MFGKKNDHVTWKAVGTFVCSFGFQPRYQWRPTTLFARLQRDSRLKKKKLENMGNQKKTPKRSKTSTSTRTVWSYKALPSDHTKKPPGGPKRSDTWRPSLGVRPPKFAPSSFQGWTPSPPHSYLAAFSGRCGSAWVLRVVFCGKNFNLIPKTPTRIE